MGERRRCLAAVFKPSGRQCLAFAVCLLFNLTHFPIMETTPATVGRVTNRAFRPVLWWLVVSSLLLLWRFHYTSAARATIRFTVSMEGTPGRVFPDVWLNGQAYKAGEPCGVGKKTLRVDAPGYESFATNIFVWYAGAAFGDITLARSRGRLDLEFSPAVESVVIRGTETNTRLARVTRESLHLPTDRYSVEAKFARFTVERTVDVTRNETARLAIAPSVATLNLASKPDGAEFELHSVKSPEIALKGRTPVTISDLPSGEYSLVIWRGGYKKSRSINLGGTRATNDLTVEFSYAKVSVTSEPANATISDGNEVIGRTPAVIELVPGFHRLQIDKTGYFGTNFSLTLSETDSRSVSVSLANVSFVEALARARSATSGSSPDYDRAFADVEKALQIKPGDEGALGLKRTIEFNLHLRNARRFQGRGDFAAATLEAEAALKMGVNDAVVVALKGELLKGQLAAAEAQAEARRKAEEVEAEARRKAEAAQAEVRRNRPQKLLPETTRRLQHDELFEPQIVRYKRSLDTVRAAVVRAFGRTPELSVKQNDLLDAETAVLTVADTGQFFRHTVVMVVGQTTDTEVTVCFKVFSFMAGNDGEAAFLPTHARYASGSRAKVIDSMRAGDIVRFKNRLGTELR